MRSLTTVELEIFVINFKSNFRSNHNRDLKFSKYLVHGQKYNYCIIVTFLTITIFH